MMSGAIMPSDWFGRAGCVEVGVADVPISAACADGSVAGITEACDCQSDTLFVVVEVTNLSVPTC